MDESKLNKEEYQHDTEAKVHICCVMYCPHIHVSTLYLSLLILPTILYYRDITVSSNLEKLKLREIKMNCRSSPIANHVLSSPTLILCQKSSNILYIYEPDLLLDHNTSPLDQKLLRWISSRKVDDPIPHCLMISL